MTTATLARGPPLGVGGAMKIEDDEDALMEGTDEEENVQQSSRLLSSSKSNGRISHGRGFGSARGIRTNHALHIEETEADEEGDGERNSEERENEEYNNGLVMDYSAGNGNGGNKRCSSASDGEGDHDTGQDNEMTNEEDADPNGSIQSYEDYQQISGRNGRNGVSSVDSGSYRETGGTNKNPSSMDGGMSVSGGNGNGSIGKVGKNGKSFVCDICMKTFSNAANMRRHRVRHSGVKPFECRFCQKRFFRKDHMREHMNHKHNNTQMECYFCQQVFDKEKDLFQHVTRDHDVNPRELHCHYCSFSATTIGRYLWHLTTSHPRKNSHYLENGGGANDALSMSMAPYTLDTEYESPDVPSSPTLPLRTSSANTSSSRQHPVYEMSLKQRDYEAYSKRDREKDQNDSPTDSVPVSPSKLNGSSRYEENNTLVAALASTPSNGPSRSRGLRYVSLLPPNLLANSTGNGGRGMESVQPEDLTSYTASSYGGGARKHGEEEGGAEDLSASYTYSAGERDGGKLPYNLLPKKLNGMTSSSTSTLSLVSAALAEQAALRNAFSANQTLTATGSNRRKNKAPVRMSGGQEDGNGVPITSTNNPTTIKQEAGYPAEKRKLSDTSTTQFSSMLEEVMAHTQAHRHNQPSPQDLSAPSITTTNHSRSSSSVIQRPKPSPPVSTSNSNSTESVISGMGIDTSSLVASSLSTTSLAETDSEHKCPHCLIVYPDNVMYLLHKMLHSKNLNQPYHCAICFNNYPNRYEFYAHVVNHRP